MITGLWKNVELYCGHRHDEPIRMDVETGSKTLFYACPKYHPENRSECEPACRNHLYINEYEKMLNKISEKIIDAEMKNTVINLNNYKWNDNGVSYEVFSHENDKLKIKMINKKAINQ